MKVGNIITFTDAFFSPGVNTKLLDFFPELSPGNSYEILAVKTESSGDTGATFIRCVQTQEVFDIYEQAENADAYWCFVLESDPSEFEVIND